MSEEEKKLLVNSLESILNSFKIIKEDEFIDTEEKFLELKNIAIKTLSTKYSVNEIEDTLISVLEKELSIQQRKGLGYPYIGAMIDKTYNITQLVWFLSPKTGVFLFNSDEHSKFQVGTYHTKFNEMIYQPYDKIYVMANEGVIIPQIVKDIAENKTN